MPVEPNRLGWEPARQRMWAINKTDYTMIGTRVRLDDHTYRQLFVDDVITRTTGCEPHDLCFMHTVYSLAGWLRRRNQ